MLHHFHIKDHIEGEAFFHQGLGGCHPVIDRYPVFGRVRLGGADIPLRGVGPGDGKSQPGHRLGQQAPATADIQQRKPLERLQAPCVPIEMGSSFPPDEVQPNGIEFVQGGEFTLRVPPFRRQGGEFGHFDRVYGEGLHGHFGGLSGRAAPFM